jgi:hypothetical protein
MEIARRPSMDRKVVGLVPVGQMLLSQKVVYFKEITEYNE